MRSLLLSATSLALALAAAVPAWGQEAGGHMHMPSAPAGAETPPPDALDMGPVMTGALGDYAMTREASGTAWQPDASPHQGLMAAKGGWMLMGHALLNGVYDWQPGPRGGDKAFVSGMVMGMAQRQLGPGGVLQLRAMLSPDPFMGRRGLPLLLGSGETADGTTPLIDRQHPHDLFMELSGSYSRRLGAQDSVFVYAGMPGEPAFGPPAFMHRLSIMDSPEPPISHHWLDSTHVTFGVVTAGWVHRNWKLEASRFTGREPDENRYDFDRPRFDSTSARVSWNPTANLSLQASWARLRSPEQLEPELDQTRWSASAIYVRPLGRDGYWATTLAWGRRSSGAEGLDAYVAETTLKPHDAWTVFARYERVDNDELLPGAEPGPAFTVSKLSAGVVRDLRVAPHLKLGLGGLYAFDFVPQGLRAAYGRQPRGAMAFARLKLD